MGSTHVERPDGDSHQRNVQPPVPSAVFGGNEGYRTFQINGLASDQNSPSGLKEETLLFSWLMVLLRTQEASHVRYDWGYKSGNGTSKHDHEIVMTLSMDEVVTGLGDSIGQVTAKLDSYLASLGPAAVPRAVSLILRSRCTATASDKANSEDRIDLEMRLNGGCLDVRPVGALENVPPYTVTQYIERFVDAVRFCMSNPGAPVSDCVRITMRDMDEIWEWNHSLPPTHSFCMHDVICEQAKRHPGKIAISSWDGELTYAQICTYSDLVACLLRDAHVGLHDVVPVCFEKSKWTIVAVLAVMKVGAAFVLMDPTLPIARLQNMAQQAGGKTVVTSRRQHGLSTSIIPQPNLIVVEAATFANALDQQTLPELPPVPPSALLYIVFTSGSTGTPKGVKISHEAYTSSAIPRAMAVGYNEHSVVLDFASYAFDVSIDSMLLTVGNGGRLCIPSDEDRLNDINEVMRNMKVSYAGLTPSVARILDADVILSLDALGLGGEAVSARDVANWGKATRIVIGYGPCECTIGCTINSSAATGRDYISIGQGNGAAIWIVDPDNHESLMPVGAVGELLVEGPIVGQGYLNDEEKTEAAFIRDPAWLVAGHRTHLGRRGRLYKTGDLGRYDSDGSGGIVFVGRKDTQVKLRGQRVELGEIESQVRARLPSGAIVIAEVITPAGNPTLVVFVAHKSTEQPSDADLRTVQLPDELEEAIKKADLDLARVLPRYMMPSAYLPVNYIPILISGKTDRQRLRRYGSATDLRHLDSGASTSTPPPRPLNDTERNLQRSWAQALKIDQSVIRIDSNFFTLGGNSISAMRLASLCRAQGLELGVSDIFVNPVLSVMCSCVRSCSTQTRIDIPEFSLISQAVDEARLEASSACGSSPAAIEDIYPCTATQESLFTFSLRADKPYVAQRVFRIPLHLATEAWKAAWETVVAANPILRSRVAQLQEPGLQQVVLKAGVSWHHSTDLDDYLRADCGIKMDLGEALARYAIVNNRRGGRRYMVWTVHHVLYDGWSEPMILEQLGNALRGAHIGNPVQMRDFVAYLRKMDESDMQEFWRRELQGAVGPQFPALPSRDYVPKPDVTLDRQIVLNPKARLPFTLATIIRGAWALVASQYTGSDDIVFGETLTGRDVPLAGVVGIIGPLIATVPVRIRISRSDPVRSYMQNIQQCMLDRVPYQHMGMQNIRKVSPDAQQACETPTGLVIQPEPEAVDGDVRPDHGDVVLEALKFNPYPLMLACGLGKSGFRVSANFDSRLVSTELVRRVLSQLETTCIRLIDDTSRIVGEIECLPDEELNQIWHPNHLPPVSGDGSMRIRADSSAAHGSIYPPVVVPWIVSPNNSAHLSPVGSVGELFLEGALLSDEPIESPPWLLAGSPLYAGREGRVHATGDMVRLQEDGRMIFVGRKENISRIHGHTVVVEDLEARLISHLPDNIRVAAAVYSSTQGGTRRGLDQGPLIFVDQPPLEKDLFDLLPQKTRLVYDATGQDRFEMVICASVPRTLLAALKKLSKICLYSLPSYMVPSTYVVVEALPRTGGQINRRALNDLAAMIPMHLLHNIRERFEASWTSTEQAILMSEEEILRSSWAKVLRVDADQIGVDDSFFRLGGDSVLAMKLVSTVRVDGHSLTIADIFNNIRLGDMAKVFKLNRGACSAELPDTPFPPLRNLNTDASLSQAVRPKLSSPSWLIRDVLPVTATQALDIRATTQAPRTSVQYSMLYLDHTVDEKRLLKACQELVDTHAILRTVFIEHDSNLLQVIITGLDVPWATHRIDTDLEQYVTDHCAVDIDSEFPLGSMFFNLVHVVDSNGRQCLIMRLSHAQYDGISLPRLLQDLECLYTGRSLSAFRPFLSYMSRISDESKQRKALQYWRDLLRDSELSVLPGVSEARMERSISKLTRIEIAMSLDGITTANLLVAAWALVLARRLQRRDVTFGNITSGRNVEEEDMEDVVGPCYQFTPIRVEFQRHWTAIDLLHFVRDQTVQSSTHDFLGFVRISKECTQWQPEGQVFDSITHHQAMEDFECMPFGEGTCRVDIKNPHGYPAHPLKVFTIVEGKHTTIGVVGGESQSAFVEAVLDDVLGAVKELTGSHSEQLVMGADLFPSD